MTTNQLNVDKFKNWLSEKGAVVLPPSNPWEVVRFKAGNDVSVVYKNKRDQLTFTGESATAYHKFTHGLGWKIVSRARRSLRDKLGRLAARDGKKCFFCHVKYNNIERYTIEHLLSFAHGGSDNENNLCLACEDCNKAVGNMSITQKMLYRDSKLKPPLLAVDSKGNVRVLE